MLRSVLVHACLAALVMSACGRHGGSRGHSTIDTSGMLDAAGHPESIANAPSWRGLSLGDDAPLAWKTDGSVFRCSNPHDDGVFDVAPIDAPREITDLVSFHGHVCAAQREGAVSCWDIASPGSYVIPGVRDALEIAPFAEGACAVSTDGVVRCWSLAQHTTRMLAGHADAVSVAADEFELCTRSQSGTVACNADAQGIETTADALVPVTAISGVAALAAGGLHVCALRRDGTVACWGGNYGPQPVPIAGIAHATSIACGGAHSMIRPPTESGGGGLRAIEGVSCARIAGAPVSCWCDHGVGPRRSVDAPGVVAGTEDLLEVVVGNTLLGGRVSTVVCGWNASGAIRCIPMVNCRAREADGRTPVPVRTGRHNAR